MAPYLQLNHLLSNRPDLTLTEYLAFVSKKRLTTKVVEYLKWFNRWDLIEQLKDHPQFGEKATQELGYKRSDEDDRQRWQKKVSEYPEIIREMRQPLIKSGKIGIYDISYPSISSQRAGLGANYLAVTGDGLLGYLFEVVSLEGRGQFRLTPYPVAMLSYMSNPPKEYETQDSKAFRLATSANFGDILTGDQVIEGFEKVYHSAGLCV